MNTRIHYEYRDAANYRFHGWLVAAGEMNDALWKAMIRAQDPVAEGFIADQVGVPDVFGYLPTQDARGRVEPPVCEFDQDKDHCWHRLAEHPGAWELVDDTPTDSRTVEELAAAFESNRIRGWIPFDPAKRLGYD